MNIHVSKHIGVSGARVWTTKRRKDGLFKARTYISIMGTGPNMKIEDLDRIKWNPFHPDYQDNFASGVGVTKEEALQALEKDMQGIADSLWMI